MGAVTPYGCGVETLWQALLDKRSAISEMDMFDLGGIVCTRAGLIRNFSAPAGFEAVPRATAFAAAACIEALKQSGIYDDPDQLKRTALITASNFGNIDWGEDALIPSGNAKYRAASSIYCAHFTTADILAEKLAIRGLRLSLSLSCASGASAAVTAANLIAEGYAERVLIVGYDALSRFSWSGLCALRTMTRERVQPFDLNRSGTIFSEGAAALVLEHSDAATGALAYLTGWAANNNGHHMTAPAERGAGSARVMAEALSSAGLSSDQIQHINMHGTGTKPNDITESQAVHDTFGTAAASIPVTSIKGSAGHMLGAAGSAELIVSVLALLKGAIPPTANLDTPDPECNLNVITEPLSMPLHTVLSNSAGFGGCNAALIVQSKPKTKAELISKSRNRVYITGHALISALGSDNEETAAALAENESACFPLERFEVPGTKKPPEVGEAPELELADFNVSQKAYLDDASRLFLCACGGAIADSGHDAQSLDALNAGIMAGTAWGCNTTQQLFFADFINKGPRLVKPFIFPHSYANTAVSLAAMEWSLKGAHDNITTPHTASGIALIEAVTTIRGGASQCILAVGCEALSLPRLHTATPDENQGEAAAALMLESDNRSAQAEIVGCGLAGDRESAVQQALMDAELTLDNVRIVGGLEKLCGNLAGAASAAEICAALIRGINVPTLIITVEDSLASAIIIQPV